MPARFAAPARKPMLHLPAHWPRQIQWKTLWLNVIGYPTGTVTLIGICSGAVDCGAMAMDQPWGVGISGGSVERGNLTPDREALIYFGSPLGRAEPMPSWSKVRRDAAERG